MKDEDADSAAPLAPVFASSSPLVVRSPVALHSKYNEYKDDLRWDFFYSCAYCNVMEFEAQGLRFTIDHYLPKIPHKDSVALYSNLMWCCDDCNTLKGSNDIPADAVAAGHRYFKADRDDFFEHFSCTDIDIEGVTKIGVFTVEMLYLNRKKLQRIRALRREAALTLTNIVEGINGLRRLPIDKLPQRTKGEALVKSRRAMDAAVSMQDRIDALLRNFAHSELLDRDDGAKEAQRGRREFLDSINAIHPGRYRRRSAG